jgi:fumarate reductase flavoprotein subunit
VTEYDVDVIVVGAGGGGLTAGLAAREGGASVGILEKLDKPGGNTALSTGSVPGAGTRYQRAAGIEDSPEIFLRDLLRQSGPHDAEPLARRLAEISAPLVEWLVDTRGIDLRIITEYRHVGHSVPRLHAPPSKRGSNLVDDLVRSCREADVDIVVGNEVKSLLVEQNVVQGVIVGGDRVHDHTLRAGAVILAANGYAGNPALVRRWAPGFADATYFGAHGSTGEAILWGEQLGGRLLNIGACQGYAAVAYPHGSLLSWTTIEKGGMIVGADGRRFGDESVGYSGFAEDVLAHGAPVWAVFDTRIRNDAAAHEEEFAELIEFGGVRECASGRNIAAFIGAEERAIDETLSEYTSAARGERPDRFGRVDFGRAPLEPPYGVVQAIPGLFHSQGGLDVDHDGRVRRSDGSVIPGLYAVGGVAAGISGREGGGGYSSGSGLLSALGLGWLAGRTAAAYVQELQRTSYIGDAR